MAPKTRKASQKKIESLETGAAVKVIAKDTKSKASSRRSSTKLEDLQLSSTPNLSKRKISSITPSDNNNGTPTGDKKSNTSIVTEQDILNANNNQELVQLINTLVNTKQDELFTKYQNKVQTQLEDDHELISELNTSLLEKQATIDSLISEVNELKSRVNSSGTLASKQSQSINSTVLDFNESGNKDYIYESPIRRKKSKKIDLQNGENRSSHLINQDQLSKELENIGFTLDMLELLTGLRIVNFQEDETRYFFDVKQSPSSSSSSGSAKDEIFITYRLVISKSFGATAEINYIPTFLEALEDGYEQDYDDSSVESDLVENAKYLKKILPEYLCENLSFPYNTLSQFYGKVSRALNKKARK